VGIDEPRDRASEERQARHALAGELLADARHECNNQLAYVLSNLQNLIEYADDLARVVAAYRARVGAAGLVDPELIQLEAEADLDFLLDDAGRAAREGLVGATRLRDILRVLARISDDEPGERPLLALGRIVQQVVGIEHKAIGLRARLELAIEPEGSVAGAPSLVIRLVVLLVKHALARLDARGREQNLLRLAVGRREGRLALVVELAGSVTPDPDPRALERAASAAAELGGELLVEPLRTTLYLREAT
jgi:hypothetical protein